jgi:hypothetical protein
MARRNAVQAPAEPGQCKDCPEGTRRLVRRPGPRCAQHTREFKAQTKAAKHERWILANYGITRAEYDALYLHQGGACAICQRATGKTKMLSVDHDHKTGEVRGLLCNYCNRHVLGHLRDSVSALLRAVRYLLHPPARKVLTRRRP